MLVRANKKHLLEGLPMALRLLRRPPRSARTRSSHSTVATSKSSRRRTRMVPPKPTEPETRRAESPDGTSTLTTLVLDLVVKDPPSNREREAPRMRSLLPILDTVK